MLRTRAQAEKTTESELVRHTIRDCYLGKLKQREAAMRAVFGTPAALTSSSKEYCA